MAKKTTAFLQTERDRSLQAHLAERVAAERQNPRPVLSLAVSFETNSALHAAGGFGAASLTTEIHEIPAGAVGMSEPGVGAVGSGLANCVV